MNKLLTIIFCLILSSFCFAENISCKNERQDNFFPNSKISNNLEFPNIFRPIGSFFKKIFGRKSQQIVCYAANVNNLSISRNEITASCPFTKNSCLTNEKIEIITTAVDPDNDTLIYNYTVSAGKIIGKGANVVWDLSGISPGIYTITAGVDDGCGVCGQTRTQQVKIIECPNCN